MNSAMEIQISSITLADLSTIKKIAERVNETHVIPTLSEEGKITMRQAREKDIEKIVNPDVYEAIKATVNSTIVGFAAWREGYYIAMLYVDNNYQKKGIGSQLIDEIVKRAKTSSIKLKASLNAVNFYKKYGFNSTGEKQSIQGIRFIPMEYHQ